MKHLENGVNALLVVAALAMAVATLHREFDSDRQSKAAKASRVPTLMRTDEWERLRRAAMPIGDSTGAVTIVEFADFECPYCRAFDARLRALIAERPGLVSRRFVHFPLPMHRFAVPAARAAECAAQQEAFASMHDVLLDKQDSLGLKSWGSYARDAGVEDTAAVAKCSASTTPVPRVSAGTALGSTLGVRSTPTVVIKGWRFFVPPDDTLLRETIAAVAAGQAPPIVDRK